MTKDRDAHFLFVNERRSASACVAHLLPEMQLGIILILALILACFVSVRSSSPWKRGDHPPSSIMELCQDGNQPLCLKREMAADGGTLLRAERNSTPKELKAN